ncbi:ATP-dependent helicase [Candidatus Saccharibacteria bacterium]|nr:ATP-dependent helicase [Candidatus Saccharibacteria bacterium]
MPLNKAQKDAVEYLDGPLLVIAGPGTGKTQLLSSKVEYILKNTDAGPENILCLTFTESGAANMRDRLLSMIGQGASKVHIHTYHAFGSTILAEYKNYAEHFDRNLDSAIDNVTQYKIIKEIQDSLDPFDIMKSANVSDIIDTISSAKSARLSGHDLEAIAVNNIETTEQLNPKLNEILQNVKRGMKFDVGLSEVYLPIAQTLAEFTTPDPICGNIEKEANFLLLELNSIIKAEQEKEKPSISPLTTWKNKRFELDDAGNYRLSNRIANKKLLSLAKIMQKYEADLEASGLYDFADMIQQAIKILSEDEGFKLTLEERYQYILLDEFQDTNAAQAELIFKLTDYEKPIVMAVGDDDQAIFAFQGANVSNIHDFVSHFNARTITMLENYRSESPVLDLSYQIREQIEDSFAKNQKIDKRLVAHKKGSANISRHEFIESSAEYHWVASEIKKLIDAGVSQKEIAVITPKHKYVAPFLPYLKSYPGINIAYEKRDNLFEDQRVHEIITISRFVNELSLGKNPAHLLFEILSFPFLEIPPIDAIRAVNNVPRKFSLDYLLESKNERIQNFGLFISHLTAKAATSPLELFLDYLIGVTAYDGDKHSNFLKYYTESGDDFSTFEMYENLAVLREAISRHSQKSILKLADFITFVDDYEAANAPLSNTSPYQDSADSVQILTAHKSKGLEFEYVFLIATDDRAWGNAKGNNNMLALPQNLIGIRHTGITEDEKLRLFFVAITRAKSNLILTNSIKDFSDKNPARLQYLGEYEQKDEQGNTIVVSPYLPEASRNVILHYQNLPDDQKRSDLVTAWISSYKHLTGELREVLTKRLENYKLTATDLTSFIDIAYGGPRAFYERKILRAPDESYSESLTFGNLIHACFEKVTNDKLSDEDALKFYEQELSQAAVPDEDIEDLRERGLKSLEASLKKFGSLLRDENARAEVNLAHDHITLNVNLNGKTVNVPLTGKIDHIHIDPEAKTIEIYDFKTSGFKDNKWDSHPTLFKYKLQLGFYKLLLNLSPEYSKYEVKKAHILFVVPDSLDAKVHDKVYEYNDKDEELLRKLLGAVYTHIQTLDFIDDPELFVEPKKDARTRDILDFIQLLLDKTN